MKKCWYILSGFALGAFALAEASAPPQRVYGPLYRAVEEARIFYDSKEFADAIPKENPDVIMAAYREAKPRTPADLKAFVLAHFTMPEQAAVSKGHPDTRPLLAHIKALWPQLVRHTPTASPNSSLIALPAPYVVPGGRFREIYYWDSYFTMLGLVESGRQDLARDMVQNFAHLIDTYGHIPNGSRTYYLSRSQPPFFFAMVGLLSPDDPAKAYAQYLTELQTEYRFWMHGSDGLGVGEARERVVAMPDGAVLNRYWDDNDTPRDESFREDVELAKTTQRPATELYRNIRAAAASGWDFSSRWLADGKTLVTIATTEIIPIDLNSLLFGLEDAIRQGCERKHQTDCVRDYTSRTKSRRKAINHYLWNDGQGTYVDYRWTQQRPTAVHSPASFYPLFVGLADKTQAERVAATGKNEFLKPGGLVTTTITTSQQWDAPNGWAPLQWVAVSGLRRYGEVKLAEIIACRWIVNVNAVYRRSGKLVEKYDVVNLHRVGGGGEYKLQDGFGWTNGVTQKLIDLYPPFANYTSAAQCSR